MDPLGLITQSHPHLPLFLLQIFVMWIVALTFGRLSRGIHLPSVLGELFGGIILGPTSLGVLARKAYTWLFPFMSIAATWRNTVIQLGMLFFLFVAGLEVDVTNLRYRKLSILWFRARNYGLISKAGIEPSMEYMPG